VPKEAENRKERTERDSKKELDSKSFLRFSVLDRKNDAGLVLI